ncbi:unnamed protein product [Gongylonema pulchrum]|uniref:Restriction endonuclease n=1 Tax=Gongylonema pulchrum TaxID=637853 RepID=A0A183EX16_9BILA|nr:unnamed protein product [Gongylonema pulchrum]
MEILRIAVRTALEREFGYINETRGAALESIGGVKEKRILTKTGRNFQWDDLSLPYLDFVECFATVNSGAGKKQCNIEPVQHWIAHL